jgi:hypothetical protein
VEGLVIASHYLRTTRIADPYDGAASSGLARLLAAFALIGLVFLAVHLAASSDVAAASFPQSTAAAIAGPAE